MKIGSLSIDYTAPIDSRATKWVKIGSLSIDYTAPIDSRATKDCVNFFLEHEPRGIYAKKIGAKVDITVKYNNLTAETLVFVLAKVTKEQETMLGLL